MKEFHLEVCIEYDYIDESIINCITTQTTYSFLLYTNNYTRILSQQFGYNAIVKSVPEILSPIIGN